MQIQVGAQTETELKEKTLRVEHALNATKVLFDKTLFKTKDFFYLLPTLIFH